MTPFTPAGPPPALLTPGRIAERLHVALHRVTYVLRTRAIEPAAKAGTLRLYDLAAVARVRRELEGIDARTSRPGRDTEGGVTLRLAGTEGGRDAR